MKFLLAVLLLFISLNTFAQNLHYFGSIKAAKTTIDDDDITFDHIYNKATITQLATAGLSVDATLNGKYLALAQFIYKNNSSLAVDLLQLRTSFSNDVLVRLGKQRLPENLHSENIQVKALLPWISAPREVYGRKPIYSFTGASVEKEFGEHFGIHVYAGDTSDTFESRDVTYDVNTQNLYGMRLNFKSKNLDAFVNGYRAEGTLSVDSKVDSPTLGAGTNIGFTKDYKLEAINVLSSGFIYRPRDYFIMSEYSVSSSKNPILERAEAMYVSAGKEINEKWIPVMTFSTDMDVASDLSPTKTTTYAFNVNYRLDYNNILKAGIEHVNYKERGVSKRSLFTNGTPGENLDIYSVVWAFVY